jgi:hypothetical protein
MAIFTGGELDLLGHHAKPPKTKAEGALDRNPAKLVVLPGAYPPNGGLKNGPKGKGP